MLLIEGPDMVGKTTLAKAIVAELTRRVQPASYLKFGMESAGRMTPRYLMPRINRWTVTDRMHFSEVIYAHFGRDVAPSLSPADVADVERAIDQVGGMRVLVVAEDDGCYDHLIKLHHGRGEDFSPERCRRVARAYRQLAMGNQPLAGYEFKIDLVLKIRLDAEKDAASVAYVAPDKVAMICDEYARRQMPHG